jgi:hypothetical protein
LCSPFRDCAHLSGIVIPPPFIANTIVKAAKESKDGELEPVELVEKILAAAKAFDEEHEDDLDFVEGELIKVSR